MKHTEEQIRAIAIKIMEDLDNDYNKDDIHINYYLEEKMLWTGEVRDCWSIGVGIPHPSGRPGGDVIVIKIDDQTGEVITYMDAPGRPIPGTVRPNSEGKYVRAPLDL